jgi:hypothetical protein
MARHLLNDITECTVHTFCLNMHRRYMGAVKRLGAKFE